MKKLSLTLVFVFSSTLLAKADSYCTFSDVREGTCSPLEFAQDGVRFIRDNKNDAMVTTSAFVLLGTLAAYHIHHIHNLKVEIRDLTETIKDKDTRIGELTNENTQLRTSHTLTRTESFDPNSSPIDMETTTTPASSEVNPS